MAKVMYLGAFISTDLYFCNTSRANSHTSIELFIVIRRVARSVSPKSRVRDSASVTENVQTLLEQALCRRAGEIWKRLSRINTVRIGEETSCGRQALSPSIEHVA